MTKWTKFFLIVVSFVLLSGISFAQEIKIEDGTKEQMIIDVAKAEKWPLQFPNAKKGNPVIEWEIKDGQIKSLARYGTK